jgi:hypothetical protein
VHEASLQVRNTQQQEVRQRHQREQADRRLRDGRDRAMLHMSEDPISPRRRRDRISGGYVGVRPRHLQEGKPEIFANVITKSPNR